MLGPASASGCLPIPLLLLLAWRTPLLAPLRRKLLRPVARLPMPLALPALAPLAMGRTPGPRRLA